MKHGEGVLRHSAKTSGNEYYEGTWKEDKMHGYGVYHYTSGAVYSGEWVNGL